MYMMSWHCALSLSLALRVIGRAIDARTYPHSQSVPCVEEPIERQTLALVNRPERSLKIL